MMTVHMYVYCVVPPPSDGLTRVGAGGQHVDPLHLFGVIVLLAALALARGLGQARALLQQLPRAVVEQHDLRGHEARRRGRVFARRAADAQLAENLPADRLDAPRLLRVQVDGVARVEALHQQHAGEAQQQQRDARQPHGGGGGDDGYGGAAEVMGFTGGGGGGAKAESPKQ